MAHPIQYALPDRWICYDGRALTDVLTEAKAAVLSLQTVPYQRRWVEKLQKMELKREVAGTSRIEGAVFTEGELDVALTETPEQLLTRSQKQARTAVDTYRWIAALPPDQPIGADLILEIHRRMVTGADDDHCKPGEIRHADENVSFGVPKHRGADGGEQCSTAFRAFTDAVQQEYKSHDKIVQAIAAHYHLAAMHPFQDGNGRTARALEALFLQRAGLRETSFIAMSNYYYEEKNEYLRVLAETRQAGHDLTAFLQFALRGVSMQAKRLLSEIQKEISKELYRSLMVDLFGRLKTKRKRVIHERQMVILNHLLGVDKIEWKQLIQLMAETYKEMKTPLKALLRDVNYLSALGTILVVKDTEGEYWISARLDWPTKMTETDFFKQIKLMPKAKGAFL